MIWAVQTVLSKYVTFTGRAGRAEFWWWTLFTILVSIVASVIDAAAFGMGPGSGNFSPINTIASLAMFLPTLAVNVRRLHDIDKSGWWFLIIFIPLIGIIVLIYWLVQRGTSGQNRFGEESATEPTAG